MNSHRQYSSQCIPEADEETAPHQFRKLLTEGGPQAFLSDSVPDNIHEDEDS